MGILKKAFLLGFIWDGEREGTFGHVEFEAYETSSHSMKLELYCSCAL